LSHHVCAELHLAADAFVYPHSCSDPTQEERAHRLRLEGWSAAFHLPATGTGVRASLFTDGRQGVISIRLAQPAVDTGAAASRLDADAQGACMGQLADLTLWYRALKSGSKCLPMQDVCITSYSHAYRVALAFQQLHHFEVEQAIIVADGASPWSTRRARLLGQRLEVFQRLRHPQEDLSPMFATEDVRGLYRDLRARLLDGGQVDEVALATAYALTVPVELPIGAGPKTVQFGPPDSILLHAALARVHDLRAAAGDAAAAPDAQGLNYQLALMTTAAAAADGGATSGARACELAIGP
jgi:hypothetical protein